MINRPIRTEAEYKAAAEHGVTVRYGARAMTLLRGRKGIEGVRILSDGTEEQIGARACWGAGHLVRALAAGGKSVRAIAAEIGVSKSQGGAGCFPVATM